MQLQVAYHHLFQEYDAHIKASLEGDKRGQVGDSPGTPRGTLGVGVGTESELLGTLPGGVGLVVQL